MITTSHEFSFSADDLCIFVRLNKLERHDCHDQGGGVAWLPTYFEDGYTAYIEKKNRSLCGLLTIS